VSGARATERRVRAASRVDGEVRVGGDKSISHRALIIGALARGRSYIGNLSPAADVASTARCLSACGVWVRPFGAGRVSVEGSGPGRSLSRPDTGLDCENSGTTMRLLAGVLAGHAFETTLDGDDSLRKRPMRRVAEPLRAMGAELTTSDAGTAPLRVSGSTHLRGIDWTMQVPSAQVKSAVLLAALGAESPTTLFEPAPSRDHTERLLRHCGVEVTAHDGRVGVVPATPQPFGLRIPGDLSSAAFFLALAAARTGWRVRCRGVGLNPGRTGVLDVLRAMRAEVEVDAVGGEGPEPLGDLAVSGNDLVATTLAGELVVRCIDEIPVIAVLATQAEGTTLIRDAAELRTKESDRISLLASGLRRLGAECETFDDGLAIRGPVRLRGARVDAGGDHRLAMAFAVAGALAYDASETVIAGAQSAAVSNPSFFEELSRLTL
jgi:3-phosphoshikimate 1-carboxyvinyltransferase